MWRLLTFTACRQEKAVVSLVCAAQYFAGDAYSRPQCPVRHLAVALMDSDQVLTGRLAKQ